MLALLGTALAAGPAAASTAPATSKAEVLRPVTLAAEQDINFGTIIPDPGVRSWVRVSPLDVVDAGLATPVGGGQHAVRLSGSATPGQLVSIAPPAIIWLAGPGPAIRLRSWRSGGFVGLVRNASTGSFYRVTAPDGRFEFRYGATIDIEPDQPDGDYTGIFTITMDYP